MSQHDVRAASNTYLVELLKDLTLGAAGIIGAILFFAVQIA